MNNKFIRVEAKVLTWGMDLVSECNNQEQVDYAVKKFGEPDFYMTGFTTWQQVSSAKRCYEDMFGLRPTVPPTEAEKDWFWQKQLEDEKPWNEEEYRKKIEAANKVYDEIDEMYYMPMLMKYITGQKP